MKQPTSSDASSDLDDRCLVEQVLAGDRQRYAVLVHRYHRPLLNLATNRLGNASVAEDAVQDTFVSAYRSLHTYKSEFSFRTWLWTILLNHCRRHASRLARLPRQIDARVLVHGEQTLACNVDSQASPELAAMHSERHALLSTLLLELPEARADAIRLRFYGQLKYREIASVMNSSLNAAKQRVRLGLETLGEMIRERKLTDSAFPEDKS